MSDLRGFENAWVGILIVRPDLTHRGEGELTDLHWFDSKDLDNVMKELVLDALFKGFTATFEELFKANGAADVLSAMKPHMKATYDSYFLSLIQGMHIKGKDAQSLLTVFNLSQAFAVPINGLESEMTQIGAVGKTYQCPFQHSIPEICVYFSHFASEEICQLMNPEYECIFTHHLTAGDPYCRCIFKKRNQTLKDPNDSGQTLARLPELEIPEQQLNVMRIGGITMQWDAVTTAFAQMNGVDKLEEIVYARTRLVGEDAGRRINEIMPTAKENAETLGRLIHSLGRIINQKGGLVSVSPDGSIAQITDCACQAYSPEFCGQFGALISGVVRGLNSNFEFSYDRMITKGEKSCQWTVRKKPSAADQNTPLGVLKLRFAKGEITKEQYLEAKSLLE